MKTLLLLLLAGAAPASPLLITGGSFILGDRLSATSWSFVGDGFSAQGGEQIPTFNCGGDYGDGNACFAPFQLADPLGPYSPFLAENGFVTLGEKSYILFLSPGFSFDSPWAQGSIFLSPQGTLPTVTAAGTYDVPFNVGATFCVTDDPLVHPPFPPDPGCFSVLGTAVAHYRVNAEGPNAFFQLLPTIEILPAPEPGTWLMGIPLLLGFFFAAKVRSSHLDSRDTKQHYLRAGSA